MRLAQNGMEGRLAIAASSEIGSPGIIDLLSFDVFALLQCCNMG